MQPSATKSASGSPTAAGQAELSGHPLIDTLITRRSRRFALGSDLPGSALAFKSRANRPSEPRRGGDPRVRRLRRHRSCERRAAVPARAGPETGGGQIMMSTVGRTQSSADAVATVTLFIMRDDGTYLLPRPQDLPSDEFEALVALGQERRFSEVYERMRIRLVDERSVIPRELPFTPPFNKWSANIPGATYFVPVTEVTALYLTILFAALGEEFAYFFHDDKDWLTRPAGIARFGRSKGGHLYDDVHDGRVGTIDEIETYLLEICGFEQGLMVQNIALATEALGLGGFPHYAAHRFAWTRSLGFRMRDRTFAQVLHKGFFGTLLMRLLNKNVTIPQAVGLDHEGRTIIKPFAPPFYPTMEAAVRAFVDYKFAPGTGFFRDASKPSAWRDPAVIQASIPPYTEANIQAVIGYCDYVMKHYGQFPANFGPIRTLMAFQAHHIDTEFYDRFYRPGAYTQAHAEHFTRWHADGAS